MAIAQCLWYDIGLSPGAPRIDFHHHLLVVLQWYLATIAAMSHFTHSQVPHLKQKSADKSE